MLYLVGFFLLFVVIMFIIIMFILKKSKKQEYETQPQPDNTIGFTLESLVNTLKTEKKELAKIDGLVEKMVQNFPFPDDEKEANKHFEFVYFYAKNPLPTAKMIVQMQKTLTEANPKHAKLIEEFQMRGVDARKK